MASTVPFYRMSRPEARAQVREALQALLRDFQPLLHEAQPGAENGGLPWAM